MCLICTRPAARLPALLRARGDQRRRREIAPDSPPHACGSAPPPLTWPYRVNGQLCAGEVTWSLHWEGDGDGPLVVPVGNALYVCALANANGVHLSYPSAGVLTAAASVRVGAAVKAVAPITLVIASEYN